MKILQNKKVALGTLAFSFAILFVIISSFFPFIVDTGLWNSTEFISNELIIIAIVLFSMLCAITIGQANNAQNPKSQLAKSKVSFIETSANITNISKFSQWIKKILQPRDIKHIKERELRKLGVDDFGILSLEKSELYSLENGPQKIKDRYYPGLSKYQIKKILKLKENSLRVFLVEPTYYLTVKAVDNDRTVTERSGNETSKKTVLISWSTASKAFLTIMTTMMFAALVYDSTKEITIATALITFVSRIFAMVSSAYMGYLVGCQINDIDADYINMRVLVIKEFLQDTSFKALTESELAEEEYLKTHPKETVIEEITEEVKETEVV